jgi:hypothetical protein
MLRRPQAASKTASARSREFKLRVPEDVADRIEEKAKAEGRPQNRIIINELAEYPELKKSADLGRHVERFETLLLRYGKHITWQELSEELLAAVDAVNTTQGAAQQIAIDRLRAVRNAMLKLKTGGSK